MKAALLAVVVLTVAGMAFHLAGVGLGSSHAAKGNNHPPAAHPSASSAAISIPLFFEPNLGQTDSRVKFMARGSGYGLFLTPDEAVLSLQHAAVKGQSAAASVIRMRLDGASSSAHIQGTQPLPGKSNYFIGNDPSKWRRGIPQFGGVEYQDVYQGIDLVYYGNQQQLEYDFRVAPGAEPSQISLSFQGASTHLESGDLILTTAGGDVRFHAPRIYQPANESTGQPGANAEQAIPGSFRQLADNKIGFTIGAYDHSHELVIDPLLSYSTYLGGAGGNECFTPGSTTAVPCSTQVAVDASNNIYVAGSTTSASFPVTTTAIQPTLAAGATQNIFIATIALLPGSSQLLFATYLGGNGTDSLAGVAVDPAEGASFPNINMYVAGTTTSTNFPTTSSNAFQPTAIFTGNQTHGFLSTVNVSSASGSNVFTLSYSTYLAGNSVTGNGNPDGNDVVTGLAVDSTFNAYVTGTTTSSSVITGFPSTANGFQICPWEQFQNSNFCPTSGPPQFFASKINTAGSGTASMLYSTYFGGGYTVNSNTVPPVVIGGAIAVDPTANNSNVTNVNMYFTGTTNMPEAGLAGSNGAAGFPLYNSYQSCLDESGVTSCTLTAPTNSDAFIAKINPSLNQPNASPVYSTYLGGSGNDNGIGIAVDTSTNAYVTGSTASSDWLCALPCTFGPYSVYGGGATNAFIAKVGNEANIIFPLNFFTYIGGAVGDSGQSIAADTLGNAHVAGSSTGDLVPVNAISPSPISSYNGAVYGGGATDAFVGLFSTTIPSTMTQPIPPGDYLTYLGGNGADVGTGIALDLYGATYVVGSTTSTNFPTVNPLQASLPAGASQSAFVSKLGGNSNIVTTVATGSPSPSPLPAGTQGVFTFNLTNAGPDPASNVIFEATVPTSGLASLPSATVSSGLGSCSQQPVNGLIVCSIGSLAVNAVAQVEVLMTPQNPPPNPPVIGVSAFALANGGCFEGQCLPTPQTVDITNFTCTVTPAQTVQNGQLATFTVTLTPGSLGYTASVTLSQSSQPSIVASPAPTFVTNPLTLNGTTAATTQLNIQTVARPVTTGGLLRRNPFYAAWLPIGGLSLLGLGLGAGSKRCRWLIGALLGLVAGLILLQPACSSASNAATTTGGTQPGQYIITVTGSASTGASNACQVPLTVT